MQWKAAVHCRRDQKKCPQCRIRMCPLSEGSYPAKKVQGDWEVPILKVLLYIFQYYPSSIILSFRHIHSYWSNQCVYAYTNLTTWKCMVNLDKCPLWRGYLPWRDRKKVSTVQNTEVSTFERFISSKSSSGGPGCVHNEEVSTLERFPHREVILYIYIYEFSSP